MFLQTMSLITEDCLIYSCTQKLSLSLLVTTVWTLEASTCGPAFQASEGRLAQLMMILAVTAFLLLTMEILAKVFMNNFVSSHFFQFLLSGRHCCVPHLRVSDKHNNTWGGVPRGGVSRDPNLVHISLSN